MRVIWLNDRLVAPSEAVLSLDDPAVRFGDGVFESMRAEDGHIPLMERHLTRMERSIAALGLTGTPAMSAVRTAAETVAGALPDGVAKIRVSVTAHPTLLVEGTPRLAEPPGALTAISLRGYWLPDRWLAEHKTLSFLGWQVAMRHAAAAGVDTALLLDGEGRLGEAASHNVFCVIDGALVTAPARGLLPGITRAQVMAATTVRETALSEAQWRAADEMFTTSAIARVQPIVAVDGAPIGEGAPGPVTRRVADLLTHG